MTANTSKSRMGKARALQNTIAEDLRARFSPLGSADIHPAIMGSSGMDILLSSRARNLLPYAIECKNQEALNIWDSLKQCEANAEKERLIPLLVFKRSRTETYAVLRWPDLLALLKVGVA
jgi:hypothetical protein